MKLEFPKHLLTTTEDKFPHVFSKLEATWSDPATLCKYVDHLVTEEERFDREGFPEAVFKELFEFYKYIHDRKVCTQFYDPWYAAINRIV